MVHAGLEAVDASALVKRAWTALPEHWLTGDLHVLAVGKASVGMARAVSELAGSRLREGVVISPGPAELDGFTVLVSSHPVPTEASVAAGRRALAFAANRRPGNRLLVLLSGGASALMAVPAPGLTLDDKAETTRRLLRGGATITQLNSVRKHLSAVKGGQLAIAGPARVLTLAISDVIGDDLSVIGSGPTVGDRSTFAEALNVLRTIDDDPDAWRRAVVDHLAAGLDNAAAETPSPNDARLAGHEARVIGGRSEAMEGAAREARARGYHTVVVPEPLEGEARTAGPRFVAAAATAIGHAQTSSGVCVIQSGETTVRVVGDGLGGRNQELVLASLGVLPQVRRAAALASVGTDGIDGPTPAAGAFGDTTTLERSRRAGLAAPDEFLNRNDACHFFEALDDLVVTGPTGTNVGDLQVLLVPPHDPEALRSGKV
ncbi:MAG: glycerate kinase [Vicinamibacterales bacterium]